MQIPTCTYVLYPSFSHDLYQQQFLIVDLLLPLLIRQGILVPCRHPPTVIKYPEYIAGCIFMLVL